MSSDRFGVLRRVRGVMVTVTAVLMLLGLAVVATPADAAAVGVPVTYDGPSYPTAVVKPSANKPQSKLWYADGSWWALMVSMTDSLVHIQELQPDHTWRDTGTVVDTRVNSTGDALWLPAANQLYVVSSQATTSPRVARFGYNATARSWSMPAGFPIVLDTTGGSESAAIDRDSTGRLWVTYTRLAKLWVAVSDTAGLNWSAGFNPQVPDVALANDDISSVIAFNGRIGVLYSDQASAAFRFAVHKDTDPPSVWTVEDALSGTLLADDHINLKQLTGDSQGRVFAAVKTSANDAAIPDPNATLVAVLVRTPRADGTGVWTEVPAGTVADDHTRPIIMIDETNQELYFLATAPVSGGDIYYKKAPLANLSFPPGRGNLFIDSVKVVNNASGSKDPVSAQTGLVVLASAEGVKRYVHGEMALAGGTPPPDTTAPSVPTNVRAAAGPGRVDLSWTAATDNVAVTGYTVRRNDGLNRDTAGTVFADTAVTAGTTYSYTVVAFDAAGNRSPASAAVTATVPPDQPPPGSIALRATATGANNAEATLTVPVPAGTVAGDVLLASVDVRGKPTVTAPAGWQLVRNDVNGTSMRQATYWRAAGSAEPVSYTWRFSAAKTAVGVMLAYSGVSTTAPIDVTSGLVSNSKLVTAPSVTTSTAGDLVVGLFGVARTSSLAPPAGMAERSEQQSVAGLAFPVVAESADVAAGAAGPTGDKVASATVGGPAIGQLVTLRPAGSP